MAVAVEYHDPTDSVKQPFTVLAVTSLYFKPQPLDEQNKTGLNQIQAFLTLCTTDIYSSKKLLEPNWKSTASNIIFNL